MPNLNILLKIARTTAAFSFLTLAIALSASLFIPKANAAHFSVLSGNFTNTGQRIRAQNNRHLNMGKISAHKNIALVALQQALKKVADGSTYQWHHKRSQLRGRIKPTATYLNASGQLCRHIYISLFYKTTRKNRQELACRNRHGQWRVKS